MRKKVQRFNPFGFLFRRPKRPVRPPPQVRRPPPLVGPPAVMPAPAPAPNSGQPSAKNIQLKELERKLQKANNQKENNKIAVSREKRKMEQAVRNAKERENEARKNANRRRREVEQRAGEKEKNLERKARAIRNNAEAQVRYAKQQSNARVREREERIEEARRTEKRLRNERDRLSHDKRGMNAEQRNALARVTRDHRRAINNLKVQQGKNLNQLQQRVNSRVKEVENLRAEANKAKKANVKSPPPAPTIPNIDTNVQRAGKEEVKNLQKQALPNKPKPIVPNSRPNRPRRETQAGDTSILHARPILKDPVGWGKKWYKQVVDSLTTMNPVDGRSKNKLTQDRYRELVKKIQEIQATYEGTADPTRKDLDRLEKVWKDYEKLRPWISMMVRNRVSRLFTPPTNTKNTPPTNVIQPSPNVSKTNEVPKKGTSMNPVEKKSVLGVMKNKFTRGVQSLKTLKPMDGRSKNNQTQREYRNLAMKLKTSTKNGNLLGFDEKNDPNRQNLHNLQKVWMDRETKKSYDALFNKYVSGTKNPLIKREEHPTKKQLEQLELEMRNSESNNGALNENETSRVLGIHSNKMLKMQGERLNRVHLLSKAIQNISTRRNLTNDLKARLEKVRTRIEKLSSTENMLTYQKDNKSITEEVRGIILSMVEPMKKQLTNLKIHANTISQVKLNGIIAQLNSLEANKPNFENTWVTIGDNYRKVMPELKTKADNKVVQALTAGIFKSIIGKTNKAQANEERAKKKAEINGIRNRVSKLNDGENKENLVKLINSPDNSNDFKSIEMKLQNAEKKKAQINKNAAQEALHVAEAKKRYRLEFPKLNMSWMDKQKNMKGVRQVLEGTRQNELQQLKNRASLLQNEKKRVELVNIILQSSPNKTNLKNIEKKVKNAELMNEARKTAENNAKRIAIETAAKANEEAKKKAEINAKLKDAKEYTRERFPLLELPELNGAKTEEEVAKLVRKYEGDNDKLKKSLRNRLGGLPDENQVNLLKLISTSKSLTNIEKEIARAQTTSRQAKEKEAHMALGRMEEYKKLQGVIDKYKEEVGNTLYPNSHANVIPRVKNFSKSTNVSDKNLEEIRAHVRSLNNSRRQYTNELSTLQHNTKNPISNSSITRIPNRIKNIKDKIRAQKTETNQQSKLKKPRLNKIYKACLPNYETSNHLRD